MAQLPPSTEKTLDSLIKYRETEKAFEFIKQVDRSQKEGSLDKIHSKLLLAGVLGNKNEFNKANSILDSLLSSKILLKNNFLLAKTYYMKGVLAYSQDNDSEALDYYLKVDSIADVTHSIPNLQIKALVNIGSRLFDTQYQEKTSKFSKSEDFYIKALSIASNLKDSTAYYRIKAILTFLKYGNPSNKASGIPPIFDKAISYFKSQNDLINVFSVYNKLSQLYMLNNNYDKAELLYKDYIKISKEHNLAYNEAVAKFLYGRLLKHKNRHNESIAILESALKLFKTEKSGDAVLYASTLGMLAGEYKTTGRLGEAYETLELYHRKLDSINRAAELVKVKAIDTKYQTEKKEQQITLLTTQNQLSEQRRKNQTFLYSGLLGLFLILGIFLFLAYQNKIKTARKLNELNTLKSRFFANISHEFRTPLTLIKSPLQQLQTTVSEEGQTKQLNLIDTNANRMLELVDQLLELSKIDSGKLQIILKEDDLDYFLKGLVEPFKYKAEQNHIDFQTNIEPLKQQYFFDKDVLTKIVSNLLDNAFKYHDQGTPVFFTATTNNHQLNLKIINHNQNLKASELKNLFERFYQKNNSQTGFGIGLALVKDLVELYEGTINTIFENGQLTFFISIPLHKNLKNAVVISSQTATVVTPEAERTNLEELPVLLIVDDNNDIRQSIKNVFPSAYHILEAKDGIEAYHLAQKEIPDCIISDVMMPKIDGFELTSQLRNNELTSLIPIILLTAKASEETHLEAVKTTADAYLTKPFNHEILKAKVQNLITERKKTQERYSRELILKPTEIVVNSSEEKFIHKLENIINAHLPNPDFTAEKFAETIGLSRMQLHRKLKSLFGVSATEFIRTERLKAAAKLLNKKQLSISEVAYSVGFNDVGYFSKCFKELYRSTPIEYQKNH